MNTPDQSIDWSQGFSAFLPPESIPKQELLPHSNPLLLPKSDTDAIVICLHGWTASPYEAIPIARSVNQVGFAAAVPCLPGHGIQSLSLARKIFPTIKYSDWLKAVRTEIQIARARYTKVYLYGQSMGGAISLVMAEENLVDAVAVTAPAIDLGRQSNLLTRLLGWTNLSQEKNEHTAYFNESYPFRSVRSAQELRRLADLAKKNLSKIHCPVLECHSEQDDTILPHVAEIIRKSVSGDVEVHWFNQSGHTMPLDVEAPAVLETITKFFIKIASK